jgi:hypothetical protein
MYSFFSHSVRTGVRNVPSSTLSWWHFIKTPSCTELPVFANQQRLSHTTKDTSETTSRDLSNSPIAGLIVRNPPRNEISHIYVEEFNKAVLRAARALYGDKPREDLWKAYLAAKQNVPSFLQLIPDGAWKNLWKSQCSCRPNDSARLSNLMSLVEDMSSIGRTSTKYHDVLRLEQVFANGDQEEALRQWLTRNPIGKSSGPTPANLSLWHWEKQLVKKGFDKEWLELGTRLYAAAGKLQESHRILVNLSKRFRGTDPRFTIYVILLLVSTKRSINIERAWFDFLRLLAHEKFTISTDDFDLVLKAFLGVKRYDHAAAIVCSAIKVHGKNPKKHLRVFRDMVHELLASCTTSADVNRAALVVMDLVPKGPPATYFFGTFISRINRTGDPNQIAHIIELMFESGVKPKPWHFNSLLEYSFQGSPGQSQGAEVIAKDMIKKAVIDAENDRIHSTSVEQSADSTSWFSELLGHRIDWRPKFLRREMPKAGSRVYVELMQYYAQQGKMASVGFILKLLKQYSGESMSNSTIRSILHIHIMVGDMEGAWRFFEHVIKNNLMIVDFKCYAIMWRGLLTHLSTTHRLNRDGYPSPRELFCHMVTHMVLEKSITQLVLQDPFTRALYERIIKCFCVADDTIGVFIALEELYDTFGTLPTIRTMKNVVKHIAIQDGFMNMVKEAPRQPWVRHVNVSLEMLESASVEVNPQLRNRSAEEAQSVRENLLQLDESSSGKDILQLLSRFVRKAADLLYRQPSWTRNGIAIAKKEMGCDAMHA